MSNDKRTTQISGEPLSAGSAWGTLCLWGAAAQQKNNAGRGPVDADAEIERLEKELSSLIGQLERSVESLEKEGYSPEAEIIRTHLYLLKDEQFRRNVRSEIRKNEIAAEAAVDTILGEMIRNFEQSESPLFFERAGDIRDIIEQLKQRLSRREKHLWDYLHGLGNVILAVQELTPSLLLEARKQNVTGFIVKKGTSLSHAVILAKSFAIPVIRISSFHRLQRYNLKSVLIDEESESVILEPSSQSVGQAETRQAGKAEEFFDSLPVNLWVNIIDPQQMTPGLIAKIKGVGLYRTEALFMEQEDDFPSEQRQKEVYDLLFEKCRNIPVTLRTADIGGDKMLPYFSLGPQENPYLGFRAHRIFRFHPDIFITQVRAVLKAAVNASQLKLLYPMIETTDELFFVKDLVSRAVDSLRRENAHYKKEFEQGIMIEVPSIAWNYEEILEYIDFASLGTNDLFQYFFAVDRNNANAYRSYQPENPAAIQMLKYLVEASRQRGKPLSICGEIASNRRYLPLLIGLGFEDISIDVHTVGTIGRFLNELDVAACKEMAEKCLAAKTSREADFMLNDFMPQAEKAQRKSAVKSAELTDPICGMVVHADDSYVVEQQGEKYYFCSLQCKNEFEAALHTK
jgi:phosphoenolpyruvate-protein phosphotransferase